MMPVRLLKKYPLLSAMTTYGSVWTVSSITQQKIVSHHKIDYGAVARNATVGFFVMAPLLHGWYRVVARVYGTGPRTWKLSVKISAVEQLLFGPVVLISYFSSTALLAGKSYDYIKAEVRTKLPTTFATSCCVFPFVNFINHLYVPFHFKVVYQTSISFLWNIFLCLMKEKPVWLNGENKNQLKSSPQTVSASESKPIAK